MVVKFFLKGEVSSVWSILACCRSGGIQSEVLCGYVFLCINVFLWREKVAGIIIYCNLIKYIVVYDCIIYSYIFYIIFQLSLCVYTLRYDHFQLLFLLPTLSFSSKAKLLSWLHLKLHIRNYTQLTCKFR